ncbi:MAG: maleylpyruvate isomerase family mycothiol-dependent enzyme [Candidatus Dormibacter sp.]
MTTTMTLPNVTDVATIPKLGHSEAMVLAENEFARTLDLLRELSPDDWRRQTVCELWDARAMVAHMLGMAEAQASFLQFLHDFRAANKRTGGAMIDAMTQTQVRERADLSPSQLIERFAAIAPRAVRARRRVPGPVRSAVRLRQDPPFHAERWQYGYLVDTIFTRDPWVHRLDISRAVDRTMVLTPGHDGRLIADVVADWARRHGKPFSLVLTGPAGGCWRAGTDGEHIEIDALDFCWTLAGRLPGSGLLSTPVPF